MTCAPSFPYADICAFIPYCVIGGIFPHISRANHACNANCRYKYNNGQIEVWARRDIEEGEEVTISYRSCGSSFPGLAWDVVTSRQQQLKRAYNFECTCSLCMSETEGFESSKCPTDSCPGYLTPNPLADHVACPECAAASTKILSDRQMIVYLTKELWKSSAQVLNVVKLLEQQWEGDGLHNLALAVDVFEKAKRVYQSMRELLHPYHLGLYRAAALCVAICAHLKSLPESTIENTNGAIHDITFGKSMSTWLETMDATAVHMHSADDLMRLPILKLRQTIASHKQLACSALHLIGTSVLDAVGHFNKHEVRNEMQQIETEIKNLLVLHKSRVCASAACAKIASCSTDLLRCGRCGQRRYCSQTHQRQDWKTHKKECKSMAKLRTRTLSS